MLTVTDLDGDVATVAFRLAPPTVIPPPADRQPTFGDAAVQSQQSRQGETITPVVLCRSLRAGTPR